ncbi:hypothetical protein [Serpentinicella alkaliphila]|uniref:Uncharacterized protein n=1 Tax=Serpentinicella alkaliphila TaxID=1734049 RepID=A0A4R2TLR1_9FIRM|nr:hypothetical protein EDD79_100947 [Serpentinicella alkaliphila]
MFKHNKERLREVRVERPNPHMQHYYDSKLRAKGGITILVSKL